MLQTVGSNNRGGPGVIDMSSPEISRRAALRLLCAGTGAVVLSACGVAAPSAVPTTAPAKPAAAPTAAAVGSTPAPAAAAQPKTGGRLVAAKLGDYANLDGHHWAANGGLHVW